MPSSLILDTNKLVTIIVWLSFQVLFKNPFSGTRIFIGMHIFHASCEGEKI